MSNLAKPTNFQAFHVDLNLFEDNVHDQDTLPNGELAVLRAHGMQIVPIFPLDPRPPCSILIEFQALASHYIH